MVSRVDFQEIKKASVDRCGEIIAALTPLPAGVVTKRSADHPCPVCRSSSTIWPDSRDGGANSHGRIACRSCTENKPTGDIIATVAAFCRISQTEAAKRIGEYLGLDVTAFTTPEPENIVEAVARDKRMPLDAFKQFEPVPEKRGRGKTLVARVPVYNELGEQHSYFDFAPNVKGWYPRGKGTAGMFFPGRLPQPGETWCMVEGCKDAAALVGLGYNAAGMPGSCLAEKYCRLFKEVHVILVPDLDIAGRAGAQKTGGRLKGIAASVRIARLPGEIVEKGGDDVRDVLRRGGSR